MEHYDGPNNYETLPGNPRANRTKLRLVVLACVAAVVVAILIIASGFKTRAATTSLAITVSDQSAEITIHQAGHEDIHPGTGNQTVRLDPGNYVVNAKSSSGESSKGVDVQKDQDNSISIDLKDLTTPTALAEYTAQDIYVVGKRLQFLNTPFQTLRSFTPGDFRPTPIAPDVYPVTGAYWLNDHQLYAQYTNKRWAYVDGNTATDLFKGSPAPITSISFNKTGAYAYIDTSHALMYSDSPGGTAKQITKALSNDAQISLANNGDILIYTPKQSYQTDSQPTRWYKKSSNQMTTLPDNLQDIGDVTWSPDSQAFAYTTNNSINVALIASLQTTQLTATVPTDPNSLAWTSASRLLYVQNDSIWDYRIDEQSSSKMANVSGDFNSGTQPFFINQEGTTAYYGTIPDGTEAGNIYSLQL